jgi:putative oxidoreductase
VTSIGLLGRTIGRSQSTPRRIASQAALDVDKTPAAISK